MDASNEYVLLSVPGDDQRTGCTTKGICGKTEEVANLQDLLIYTLKGIAVYAALARELKVSHRATDEFMMESLFSTITNANFSADSFVERIQDGLRLREGLGRDIIAAGGKSPANFPDAATWTASADDFEWKAALVGVLATEDEDVRSLRELLTYGVQGSASRFLLRAHSISPKLLELLCLQLNSHFFDLHG